MSHGYLVRLTNGSDSNILRWQMVTQNVIDRA